MSDEKPKKYYALNLTEGRIFIIFISTLILITMLVIGISLLIFKPGQNNKNNTITENTEDNDSASNSNEDLEFYYLSDEIDELPEIESLEEENAKIDNENEDEVFSENITQTENDKDEILFSSKYIEDSNNKKNTQDNYKKPENTKETKQSINHNKKETINNSKKSIETRYAVQVGSYTSKKTAEDISIYYKMQGYPTYIQEKIYDGKTFYRLRVGPFRNKNKANEYLSALRSSKYGRSSQIFEFYKYN